MLMRTQTEGHAHIKLTRNSEDLGPFFPQTSFPLPPAAPGFGTQVKYAAKIH